MSLQQLAAQHMAAQGRGPDSQLVHMSPREVAGLQALAKASGGSLTTNPHTGLPEAGFLDKMLPMLLGAGAIAATGGAAAGIAPWMVGLGIGGLETARTGSLSKGLMAGLGAYGGAGLAGGLLGAGAAGAAEAGLAGAGTAGAGTAANIAQAAPTFDVAGLAASPVDLGVAGGATAPASTSMFPAPDLAGLDAARQAGRESIVAQLGPGQANMEAMGFSPMPTTTAMPTVPSAPAASMPPPYSNADYFSASDYGMSAPSPTPSAAGPAALDTEMGTSNAQLAPKTLGDRFSQLGRGIESLGTEQGRSAFLSGTEGGKKAAMYGAAAGLPLLISQPKPLNVPTGGPNPYRYRFESGQVENPEAGYTGAASGQRRYFDPRYVAYAGGGPVEQMSNANAVGANTGYPMANVQRNAYAVPYQQPMSQNVVTGPQDTGVDTFTGEPRMAGGGISHLGDYSDGGRLLKGPGDGVSDSIPAMIGNKQPARLADGEFVVPARIVSELGNGSTDAGARKLYTMMDRIQSARGKTTGKNKVAANSRADKYLPA